MPRPPEAPSTPAPTWLAFVAHASLVDGHEVPQLFDHDGRRVTGLAFERAVV